MSDSVREALTMAGSTIVVAGGCATVDGLSVTTLSTTTIVMLLFAIGRKLG